MKLIYLVLLISSVAVSQWSLAGQSANDPAAKYFGPSTARDVCRAVVKNDAERLQKLLAFQRKSMAFGYQVEPTGRRIAGSFTCNNMELLDFAESIGANGVSSYLATGRVTRQTEVVSTNR